MPTVTCTAYPPTSPMMAPFTTLLMENPLVASYNPVPVDDARVRYRPIAALPEMVRDAPSSPSDSTSMTDPTGWLNICIRNGLTAVRVDSASV